MPRFKIGEHVELDGVLAELDSGSTGTVVSVVPDKDGQTRLDEYTIADVDFWSRRLADWLAVGMSVYVFTHCPDDVQSPIFARDLHARIAALTPVDSLSSDPVQGTLL